MYFSCPGWPLTIGRHQTGGAAEDQRFAGKTLIKDERAVDGRDAALVAAMLDPFDNPFVDAARMQQARRQRLVVERVGKAEHIGIEDQLGALAGAERVTVDTDDAGQRPAVRIQGRGGVVGFHLEDQRVRVVEFDDTGVVLEDGETEILVPHLSRGHPWSCAG